MQRTYFDYAATTPVDPRVLEVMLPYFTEKFGNPSSTHTYGQEAHVALNAARKTLARLLEIPQEALIFTGGASEAIHSALRGIAHARPERHIVASAFEHSSTRAALDTLKQEGWRVTYIDPEPTGHISAEAFLRACTPDTSLATLLYVQNELGTLQPIQEIGAELHTRGIAFHVDAAQAFGAFDCRPSLLHATALTVAAHKFYGPKGIGALYIAPETPFQPLLGGSQEFGLRAGTQNIPAAVGMAEAARLAIEEQESRTAHIRMLHDHARQKVAMLSDCNINSSGDAPHILSITLPGTSGETLLRRLDLDGFAVATGAACNTSSGRPSHVLTSIGLSQDLAQATLRISFSHHTSKEDIDALFAAIAYHAGQIRHMNITY